MQDVPSSVGFCYRSGNVADRGWSYSLPRPQNLGGTDCRTDGNKPANAPFPVPAAAQTLEEEVKVKPPSVRCDSDNTVEMFDNPLYGCMARSQSRRKDPDVKDHAPPPERRPVPAPRHRSVACPEVKAPVTSSSLPPSAHKQVVMASRCQGGVADTRPPIPARCRAAQPEPQTQKQQRHRRTPEQTPTSGPTRSV